MRCGRSGCLAGRPRSPMIDTEENPFARLRRTGFTSERTAVFEYVRPNTVEDACRALAEGGGGARILAGGTDLLVEIRNRLRMPNLLIDIKRVPVLNVVETDSSGTLSIGAAVSLGCVMETAAIRDRYPGLAQAAGSIATYQLRNRATVAGNLCNASPAADMAPILLALSARLLARSPAGEREIPMTQFFTGVKQTCLTADEMVCRVIVPPHSEGLRTAFVKQQRIRGHDLAIVNAAGAYDPGSGVLCVAIGSCAPTPVLLEPVDVHESRGTDAADTVIDRAGAATAPISDVRASAEYRRAVLPVLLTRLLDELLGEEGRR